MNDVPVQVLVIEDEAPIRRFLRACLDAEGYQLIEAGNGAEGIKLAAQQRIDVVILDLGLPDMDGIDVIKQVRLWSAIPIIVLSARDQEKDKVYALDAGADDYLLKPFSVAELLARMRVALRHAARIDNKETNTQIDINDVHIDLFARKVTRAGEQVHLTPIEFKLLSQLVKHAGKVLTHRQLLKEVWGASHVDHSHYLRIYMGQLRHKLEHDPAQPQFLLTELGVGYRLLI